MDKAPLRDRSIHVAAPNYHLLIERNRSLSLSIDEPVQYSRPAIDVLFESAADAYGPSVAGLVLSGANQDGAEGLCQISQAGGVAIVQAPATASSPMMPEAALRRVGPSAHVVSLGDLGAFLARLVAPETRGGGAIVVTTEPIKFLLVDDTAENLVALEPLLRRDGLELLLARSGSEALELLLLHDVSLALLDVQMPLMDGFELADPRQARGWALPDAQASRCRSARPPFRRRASRGEPAPRDRDRRRR